jgi:hypothetical protein
VDSFEPCVKVSGHEPALGPPNPQKGDVSFEQEAPEVTFRAADVRANRANINGRAALL